MVYVIGYLVIGIVLTALSWMFEDWKSGGPAEQSVAVGIFLWPMILFIWLSRKAGETSGWAVRLFKKKGD